MSSCINRNVFTAGFCAFYLERRDAAEAWQPVQPVQGAGMGTLFIPFTLPEYKTAHFPQTISWSICQDVKTLQKLKFTLKLFKTQSFIELMLKSLQRAFIMTEKQHVQSISDKMRSQNNVNMQVFKVICDPPFCVWTAAGIKPPTFSQCATDSGPFDVKRWAGCTNWGEETKAGRFILSEFVWWKYELIMIHQPNRWIKVSQLLFYKRLRRFQHRGQVNILNLSMRSLSSS